MSEGEFMRVQEKEADSMTRNGKKWFSVKAIKELVAQAKDLRDLKKRLSILDYEPNREAVKK